MNIFHLSAECYPAAKTGGLGDVVGSLPKYLRRLGVAASVVIPKYRTSWLQKQIVKTVYSGSIMLGDKQLPCSVQKTVQEKLDFPLFVVDLPKYFNRSGIYNDPQTAEGYKDEAERFIAFQRAVLQWLAAASQTPDLIHCHDHHTALVPFMMTRCPEFKKLDPVPTVLTVHHAAYQGWYSHEKQKLLPAFDPGQAGLLDWDGQLNALAAGLKCCWQITTVSPSYMKELSQHSYGLETLFKHEQQKSQGIINGIDEQLWNPKTDALLTTNYAVDTVIAGKEKNKQALCETFGLDPARPTVSFIGRLVAEKGADLLPDLLTSFLKKKRDINFMVLGTGNSELHQRFEEMNNLFAGFFAASLTYSELLAHQIYGGSDFLLMPSRSEPCGLNQLYAMHYGTIPIVRATGGLKDTVFDIVEAKGNGFVFSSFSLEAAAAAINRAVELYQNKNDLNRVRQQNMKLDYSWNASAKTYLDMYKTLTKA